MPDPLNLLFIWTDQQRFDTMAAYGNHWVQTPNLNRLAAQSVVFDRAYCCAPVCTPSRASILTGLYPHQHGCVTNNVALPADTPTFAEMLPDNTYTTAYMGKWHLGDEIVAQHGFDHWVSLEDDMYRAFYSKPQYLEGRSDYHYYLVSQGVDPDMTSHGARVYSRGLAARLPEEHTKARFLGRKAAEFLRSHTTHGTAKPFVMHVNFLEPHSPFFGPLDDLYDPAALPVDKTFLRHPDATAARRSQCLAAYWDGHKRKGFDLTSEAGWRRIRANYFGNVTLIDRAVGDILAGLEASGAADRTVVVFTSDHGEQVGDHALLTKTVMYEQSSHIPLLMRVPGVAGGTRVTQPVSQVDLVPTLLDLLGHDVPNRVAGKSLARAIHGEDALDDNDVFIEWHGGGGPAMGIEADNETDRRALCSSWRTIVHNNWKLCLSPDDNCELYDLDSDPHEFTNRYNDTACADVVAELTSRVKAWQQRTGDDFALA